MSPLNDEARGVCGATGLQGKHSENESRNYARSAGEVKPSRLAFVVYKQSPRPRCRDRLDVCIAIPARAGAVVCIANCA